MTQAFTGPYQGMYAAGLARQRATVARQRALGAPGMGRFGVSAGDDISRAAGMSEAELAANTGEREEQERLEGVKFQQRKDLMQLRASLGEAAAAKERELRRRLEKKRITGQMIGGLLAMSGEALQARQDNKAKAYEMPGYRPEDLWE